MKIETILNAMIRAHDQLNIYIIKPPTREFLNRRGRQYHTFRTRILKMDAEKDDKIAYLGGANFILVDKLKEKNEEIKALQDTNDAIHKQLIELQELHKFNLGDWVG